MNPYDHVNLNGSVTFDLLTGLIVDWQMVGQKLKFWFSSMTAVLEIIIFHQKFETFGKDSDQ